MQRTIKENIPELNAFVSTLRGLGKGQTNAKRPKTKTNRCHKCLPWGHHRAHEVGRPVASTFYRVTQTLDDAPIQGENVLPPGFNPSQAIIKDEWKTCTFKGT